MFEKIQRWSRRRKYREGKTLSQFIARDVRRDILIVSAARLDEGIITGCVRTTNVLYASKGLVPQPDFEPARELHIREMWHWTGQSWGGLPDGTSLVNQNSQPSEEETLLVSLKRLSDALCPHDSHWAGILARLHDDAAGEFVSGTPVSQKYKVARKIERLFGGMGSLNDIQMPGDCERLHGELFSAVKSVLGVYWRALGRPSYTAKVTPLPIGAAVRLIPGTTHYFERDESPAIVPDTPEVRGQVWRVVRCDGPDITNMLSYTIQHENTFMGARHESLELVRE